MTVANGDSCLNPLKVIININRYMMNVRSRGCGFTAGINDVNSNKMPVINSEPDDESWLFSTANSRDFSIWQNIFKDKMMLFVLNKTS